MVIKASAPRRRYGEFRGDGREHIIFGNANGDGVMTG